MKIHNTISTPQPAATHDPIVINGNSQFTSPNGVSAGDGSYGNPYIIKDWVISASGANGIDIQNTNAHVIVQNCSKFCHSKEKM